MCGICLALLEAAAGVEFKRPELLLIALDGLGEAQGQAFGGKVIHDHAGVYIHHQDVGAVGAGHGGGKIDDEFFGIVAGKNAADIGIDGDGFVFLDLDLNLLAGGGGLLGHGTRSVLKKEPDEIKGPAG